MVCFLTFNEEASSTCGGGVAAWKCALVLRVPSDSAPSDCTGERCLSQGKNRVRLDGGFASPKVLDFLDCEPKVEYLVNMAANAVLKRKVESP